MESVYACRSSDVSINQYIHGGHLFLFNYFGDFFHNFTFPSTQIPPDFPLANISANISVHFSTGDTTSHPKDVAKLQSKVKSIIHVQMLEDDNFGHADFALGINAHKKVYANILSTWRKHVSC